MYGLGPVELRNARSSGTWGKDICPHFSTLFSTVKVNTLGRTDAPPKESHQMFKEFAISELILNLGRGRGLIMRLLLCVQKRYKTAAAFLIWEICRSSGHMNALNSCLMISEVRITLHIEHEF